MGDVDFDPYNKNNAVAVIYKFDPIQNQHYYQIIYSQDGGQTWKPETGLGRQYGLNSRIEETYIPGKKDWLYASCAAQGGKVWISKNGGRSFSLVTLPGYITGVSWYNN